MSYRDNNLDYLADIGVVFRWCCKQYEIKRADLELLLYLHQFKFFTRDQFKNGEMLYSWDKHRHARLLREDWMKKVYEGNRRMGEHDKYAVSQKGVRMLRRLDRILDGKEEMPQTHRNKAFRGKRYSDKILTNSIKNKYK